MINTYLSGFVRVGAMEDKYPNFKKKFFESRVIKKVTGISKSYLEFFQCDSRFQDTTDQHP